MARFGRGERRGSLCLVRPTNRRGERNRQRLVSWRWNYNHTESNSVSTRIDVATSRSSVKAHARLLFKQRAASVQSRVYSLYVMKTRRTIGWTEIYSSNSASVVAGRSRRTKSQSGEERNSILSRPLCVAGMQLLQAGSGRKASQ